VIFVTVGSQMAFDRLVGAMDDWTAAQSDAPEVFAQIGPSSLRPAAMRWSVALTPQEFDAAVDAASVIVAHAGMGSVLTAMEKGKVLVLMPRLGERQETRNDHQVATARWLASREGIFIAMDEHELPAVLATARAASQRTACIAPYASDRLIAALRSFVG
jgi:UDP-N-acetylglucosamine transferase subunit ALG13